MEDVLDGRVAKADQGKAVHSVEEWLDGVSISGAKDLGRSVFISCEWGQNNPEVWDGYRLRCSAEARQVEGWHGRYSDFIAAIGPVLKDRCPGIALNSEEPAPGGFTTPTSSACSDGLTLGAMVSETMRPIDGEISPLAPIPCAGSYRCISGPDDNEFFAELSRFDWCLVLNVSVPYYTDRP